MPMTGEVLIVDDTPQNLQVLSAILRAEGLAVRLAPHGAFALASVRARLPDLVLLDVRMPGLDGFETCRRLRDDPATCAVPVLFLSASDNPEERIAAFAAGGLDFIPKPFHAAEVLARVSTHLALARLRRDLVVANTRLTGSLRDEQEQRQRVERLAAERQVRLAQSEKLEALGRMTGGLVHDFNNHLAVLGGNLELLDMAVGREPAVRRRLDTMDRTITAATALVRSLLTFARRRTVELEIVRPAALLGELHEMLASVLGRRIRVVVEAGDPALAVRASREQVQNALLNLCLNARDAMPDGGDLTLGVAEVRVAAERCRICAQDVSGGFVAISVRDTGAGIPTALQERIFEPFFTTKAEGQGTGLGLAAVAGCVTAHHGHLLLDSAPGRGTCFRLLLPPAPAPEGIGAGSPGEGSGAAAAVGRKAMAALV